MSFEVGTDPSIGDTGWFLNPPYTSAQYQTASGRIVFGVSDGVCTVYTKLHCANMQVSGGAAHYYWVVIEDRLSNGTLRT